MCLKSWYQRSSTEIVLSVHLTNVKQVPLVYENPNTIIINYLILMIKQIIILYVWLPARIQEKGIYVQYTS